MRIAIVGGGAAGLMAAVAAARAGAQVTLLEAANRVGKKILATGNGRCNLTNTAIKSPASLRDAFKEGSLTTASGEGRPSPAQDDGTSQVRHPEQRSLFFASASSKDPTQNAPCPSSRTGLGAAEAVVRDPAQNALQSSARYYNAPAFVAPTLARWDCTAIRACFAELGLLTVEEREGRVFPATFSANSVLNVLRMNCERSGVETRCDFRATAITGTAGDFTVSAAGGERISADAVIVATGGGSKLLAAWGHALVPFEPVLCALACDDTFRGLSGVRVHASVTLERDGESVCAETGEVQFRDDGLSGIVIFNLSRHAQPGDTLVLDLVPSMEEDELREYLRSLAEMSVSLRDAFKEGSLTTDSA